MPFPIRDTGATPPTNRPPTGPEPDRPALGAPAAPEAPVDALGSRIDRLRKWAPLADALDVDLDDAKAQVREVSPWVQEKIEAGVHAIFAPRPEQPSAPAAARPAPRFTVWDPATAPTNADGSIRPPQGRDSGGMQPPGLGVRLTPPGLGEGNSVFRYGPTGGPSNFTILDQGSTNGCGTTSLSMMLNYFAGRPAFDRPKVDASIRHFNMFTAPGEIVRYAESQNLEASLHAGTTLDELRATVDGGLPVQVLLDVSEAHDGTGLHYEVVTGYGTGPDGKRYVELANPWGIREYMPEETFVKHWTDLKAKGFPLGIGGVAITMKPPGHPAPLLRDERNTLLDTSITALRVADGLTQVTTGWARRDWPKLLGGATRLLLGGLAAIPALLGNAGRRGSQAMMHDGAARVEAGQLAGGLGRIAGGAVGWVATGVVETAGDVLSLAADTVAKAVGGLSKAIGGLF